MNTIQMITVTYLGEQTTQRDFDLTIGMEKVAKEMGVTFRVQQHDVDDEFQERSITFTSSRVLNEEERCYLASHFEDLFTQINFGNMTKLF